MDTDDLWKSCSEALREQVSDASWQAYLSGITPLSIKDGEIVLGVPNTLIRDRVESRFLGLIQATVTGTVGRNLVVQLEVVAPVYEPRDEVLAHVDTHHTEGGSRSAANAVSVTPSWGDTPSRPTGTGRTNRIDSPVLDLRYTFDAFVIASSNRFAHAAAQSVAESPARSYNPSFHLRRGRFGQDPPAPCHRELRPGELPRTPGALRHNRDVSSTSSSTPSGPIPRQPSNAATASATSCSSTTSSSWRTKKPCKRSSSTPSTTSTGPRRQVVLTSDRAPKSIATFEDRLRSRFMSGLITDVQPPELETRLAILQKKLERDPSHDVPHEVLEFIASNVTDNIRELEGALIRVTAYGSLNNQPLTRELAEHVLSDIVSADQPRRITPQVILDATTETFGFSVEELCGPNRRRPLVTARQVSMYVFRELTDFSYPAIGREFGGRDHSTVMHAVEKIATLMKERHQIYNQVTDLIVRIKSGS
jgi:chromosomal replication initiator protein